ncbi:hypothetical protein M514_07661 [Trichuris suis]|uniref:WAP domain-containing protein n=1 Tax=Trichuris suis TaxID=68888 RepID=A0A085N8H8_9BILA
MPLLIISLALPLLSFVGLATSQVICPDNSMPIQWCPRGLCPTGYYCFSGWCCRRSYYGGGWNRGWNSGWHYGPYGFWNRQLTPGWNNRWNSPYYPGGRCPRMYGRMIPTYHQCYSHNQCPARRLCCNTVSGRRCLFPV